MTDEHQALSFTIGSAGWLLVLKKSGERQKEYMNLLLDPRASRTDNMPDDYLRGYIAALIWAATWPRKEVELAAQEEREENEEQEGNSEHELLASVGHTAGIDSRRLED